MHKHKSNIFNSRDSSCMTKLILTVLSCFLLAPICNYNNEAQAVTSGNYKQPQVSIILILPQSFRVPTNPLQNENFEQPKLKQHVALINNARDELEDERLRQKYRKLTLQLRDARSPITGQLFYEHVFDYFQPNVRTLLVPINLDQVSPNYDIQSTNNRPNNTEHQSNVVSRPQQLIVSVRPYQLESGFGSDNIEFASSAPIPVESVPSNDGRRSFAVVQTDKPIYKPEEKVRIRSLIVNENLRPVVGDELKLQIKNPHKIIVEEIKFPTHQFQVESKSNHEPLYLDHTFEFPPEPMLGSWSVQILHNDPIANDTTSFEVKEYVLPTYEIEFESPRYILPSTLNITGSIVAKYHYGKPVQGKAQFKFGYKESHSAKPKFVARSSIKTIDPQTGRVDYRINSAKFQENDWFPGIAGSKFVVEATVTEMSTGHREVAQDTQCTFIAYPYRISFEDSIEDFKPGLSQQLNVQVFEVQTLRPAPKGARIIAQYWDQNSTSLTNTTTFSSNQANEQRLDFEAFTDSNGRASFNIGPLRSELTTIQVTLKWLNTTGLNNESLRQTSMNKNFDLNQYNELAIGHHTLIKHDSSQGWISIMNKGTTNLNVGDQFVSDILVRDAIVRSQEIYYIITVRGQIHALDGINPDGLIKFTITEDMMPTIRLILFARTSTDSVISDSMKINIGQTLDCGLKLRYKSDGDNSSTRSNSTIFKPNDKGKITIKGRQGDLVSLIGVDAAVYTLNNRAELDPSRLIQRVKRLDAGCGFGGGKNDLDVFYNAGLMFIKDFPNPATSSYLGSSCMTILSQLKHIEDIGLGYSRPMFSAASIRPRVLDLASAISRHTNNGRVNHRAKREVDIETILKRYKDPYARSCCRIGTLEDLPQRRNCSVRARIVEKHTSRSSDSLARSCSMIYLDCCRAVFGEQVLLSSILSGRDSQIIEQTVKSRILTHQEAYPHSLDSLPNVGHLDRIETQTLIRKDFRETWLFDLVSISEQDGSASLDVQLPHSITSWSISALALNRYQPMCIMTRPLKLTTFQEIFIQLLMPYKVIQGEQIDLIATIFNYSPQNQEVFVYMYGIEDVCSEAEAGERSERKRVRIDRHASQAVIFPMIPLKVGKYPVKILAVTANGSASSDIIERTLNVVPRGKVVTDETTFSLDPMNHQRRNKRAIQTGNLVDEIDSANGVQRSKVRLTPTRDSELIVPQTHECIISAIGDKLGQTVQTSMIDVENLIRLPHGCGEQVMIYLGPTLYTARYLSSINKLTGDLRWRSIRYIQSGYKRILNYRKESGAFSAFSRRDPSIWLTAFIAKMLCQTERTPFVSEEIHVDKTVINSALNWLIEAQNKETGTWIEINPVYHREMLGGVLKENALTAFVTLSLNECAHHSPDLIEEINLNKNEDNLNNNFEQHNKQQTNGYDKLKLATKRAEQMLLLTRYKASKERNPYVLALTAYALSFSRPKEAVEVLDELMMLAERSQSRNQLFWVGDYSIETAAYALQAMIELAPLIPDNRADNNGQSPKFKWQQGSDAIFLANWLSTRRSYTGAFESTQDTVVALEALSKFAQLQSTPNNLLPAPSSLQSNLICNVTMSNRTKRSIAFGNENAQVLQTFKLESFDIDTVNGEMLDIITSGNGLGTMSVKLKYNVFQEEDELCRFDIDSSIVEWQPEVVPSSQTLVKEPTTSNNQANSNNNDSNEDDYFKNFDKTMLSELNLIYLNQLENEQHSSTTQPPAINREHMLRVRRYASHMMDLSSKNNSAPAQDSWTSKVVSALKSNINSWINPKMTTKRQSEMLPPPLPQITANLTNQSTPKKTNTSRRSAQTTPMPLIVHQTSTIQSGVKLNSLSKQIDYNETNSNSGQQANPVSSAHRLVLLLRVCVHHMSTRRDSEMAVIEIGVLSGFKPNEADLKEIESEIGTPVMKYEMSADKSMVIIYMEHIPFSGPFCLQFRLIRDSLVYNLQSGYIRVYEYYSPVHSCSNIYTPSRISNLIETKCDSSGQVCQCASKSLCPATNKLIDLGEIYSVNATSARNQLMELVCSNKFNLVSLVKLKNVRYLEAGKIFKLAVKVKSDLRGNLTKIIDLQRQQKSQLMNSVRKPPTLVLNSSMNETSFVEENPDEEETSLDYLNLSIDSSCVRNDPILFHLAHPNQWKQGGDLMILFARYDKLDKKFFKTTTMKISSQNHQRFGGQFPRPKATVISGLREENENQQLMRLFEDAQQLQYSTTIQLDKNTIMHDMSYQAKQEPRETINNLIFWLELRSRREKWICPS